MLRKLAALLLLIICSPARADGLVPQLMASRLAVGQTSLLERELAAQLGRRPNDNQLIFALGATQFLLTVEGLSQDLYRYGLKVYPGLETFVPMLSFALPQNPAPEKLDYDKMRAIFKRALRGFENSERTLARMGSSEVQLPLDLGLMRFDIDRDGTASEHEGFSAIFATPFGNAPWMNPANRIAIGFDRGDAAWLRGYCNLIIALLDFLLAYDNRASFEASAQLVFPDAGLPLEMLNKQGLAENEGSDIVLFSDMIAAIHTMHWPVTDPALMKEALRHLQITIAMSRDSWRYILAETDDQAEWIPSPRQKSGVIPGFEVTPQTVGKLMILLSELDAMLHGRKLMPHWRLAKGINLRRVFLAPQAFDPVMWIQGSAALPYLENGTVSSGESLLDIMDLLMSDPLAYAVLLN